MHDQEVYSSIFQLNKRGDLDDKYHEKLRKIPFYLGIRVACSSDGFPAPTIHWKIPKEYTKYVKVFKSADDASYIKAVNYTDMNYLYVRVK